MVCDVVKLPGGGTAIVCSGGPRKRCPCGNPATLLCDWIMTGRRSGTCDAPLCAGCTTSPAHDKDLCASHAAEFERWKEARAARRGAN